MNEIASGNLPGRCAARVATFAPKLTKCNHVEANDRSVLDLDNAVELRVVAAIGLACFQMDLSAEPAVVELQFRTANLIGSPHRWLTARVVDQVKASDPLQKAVWYLAIHKSLMFAGGDPQVVT